MKKFLGLLIFMFLITENVFAKCKKEDYENFVSTKKICIGIEPVGTKVDGKFLIPERKKLLVYLHGYRGPVQNDRKLINSIKNKDSNAILMAMPGYLTPGWKNKSSGSKKKQYSKSGTEPIAQAIVKLKNYYKPEETILIGYSNGAGRAAIIAAKYPNLIDKILLIACPCDLSKWKIKLHDGKINPIKVIKEMNKKTIVYLVVGQNDKETPLVLSERYFKELQNHKIDSEILIVNAPHTSNVLHVNKKLIEFSKNLINK